MSSNHGLATVVAALCEGFPTKDAAVAAAIDLAVLVAAADGRIDPAELATLTQSFEVALGTQVSPMFVRHLVQASVQQMREAGVAAHAQRLGETFAARGCVDDALRLALLVANASDGVSQVERDQIDAVASAAGVSTVRVDELYREIQARAA